MVEKALVYGPAINTGVYAYDMRRVPKSLWDDWFNFASQGSTIDKYIPDEVACQILLPKYNFIVAPTSFNISVRYDPNTEDKRIIHLHGRKHCGKYPLCRIWIKELIECIKNNTCNIREFMDRKYGDRTLAHFLDGHRGHIDLANDINTLLGRPLIQEAPVAHQTNDEIKPTITFPTEAPRIIAQNKNSDMTIVTSVDRKYLPFLKLAFPNWIKHKHLDRYPFLVYVNGFNTLQDEELRFLWEKPYVTLKAWNLPSAQSQRENMLSAFVLGVAKDVTTKLYCKIDSDAFATDNSELITEAMKASSAVLIGHRWRYSKPPIFVSQMDEWAKTVPELQDSPTLFDPKCVDGRRYNHPNGRVASYVCLHKMEFVRLAARLAGDRLPIPSHDSYLSMLAMKLKLPIQGHNFKRRSGFTNWSHLDKLQAAIIETDLKYP